MFQVEVTHKFTAEQIDDLLTCAFEGGSNYWYCIKRTVEPTEITYKIQSYLTPALNPGGSLVIVDREDDHETAKEYFLNLETIQKGLELMAKEYPYHMKNFIEENEDAETGDVFLQLCLFGEIVFG